MLTNRKSKTLAAGAGVAALAFTAIPLTSDAQLIVAHYKMDETSGTVMADSSGNGINGEYVGAPTFGTNSGIAGLGTAVTFPGDGGVYGIVTHNPTIALPVYSISFWAQGDPTGGHEAPVATRAIDGNDEMGWTFYYQGGNAQHWIHQDAATGWWPIISTGTDTAWHHYVGVFDGSTLSMYMDGALAGSAGYTGSFDTHVSDMLMIGRNGGGFPFTGAVDDVQYYGVPIGAADAQWLFDNPGQVLDNASPRLSTTSDEIRMVAGQSTSLTVATVADVEDDDGTLTVSLVSGGAPPDLVVSVSNVDGDVVADISTTGALAPGKYPITIQVEDSAGKTDQADMWVYVPSGLVAHYKLDETNGDALVDSSGNGLDGTWIPDGGTSALPTFGSTEVPAGATGTSVQFNGTDFTWGSAPSDDLYKSGQFTVSFWAKSDPQNSWRTPVAHMPSGGEPGGGWIIEYGDDAYGPHYMGFATLDAGGGQYWTNNQASVDGEWHHWVGQFDGSNMILFMDTIPVAIRTAQYAPQNADDRTMTLGANFMWGEPMNGYLDDVQYYDHGIGFSDIQELFANPGSTVDNIDPRIYMDVNAMSVPPNGSVSREVATVFDVEDLPGDLTVTASTGDPVTGLTLDVANDNGVISIDVTAENASPGLYTVTYTVTDSGGDSSINIMTLVIEGLVAHWKLDEQTGADTLVDSIGSSDAAIWGGITLGVPGASAGTGTAIETPGSIDNYGMAQNYEIIQVPIFSVSFWANGDPAGAHESIVSTRDEFYLGSENGWIMYYVNDGLEFWVHNDAPTGWTSVRTDTTTGWHHYVGTYTGERLELFMDGEFVGGTAYNGNFGNRASRSFYFGRNGAMPQGWPYAGQIDDVQYYSRALNADQVKSLYDNPGSTIADETPVRDWTLY